MANWDDVGATALTLPEVTVGRGQAALIESEPSTFAPKRLAKAQADLR